MRAKSPPRAKQTGPKQVKPLPSQSGPSEGWHLPAGCRKRHFFTDGRSVCKTRLLTHAPAHGFEPYHQHNGQYCRVCLREFAYTVHNGLHAHRTQSVESERAFAREWQKRQTEDHQLEKILGQGNVSARDARVAATIIQWLGSNIGREFLESVARRRAPRTQVEAKASKLADEKQGHLFAEL